MTERPLSRLYLPWLSWMILGLTALTVLVIISVAAVIISSHEFRSLMRFLVGILLLLIIASVVLVKFRRRFDQFIQTDGETFLRFWSPTREIIIDRSEVASIALSDRRVVVEGPNGSISIDRRYPEFESLKKVMETWRSSEAIRDRP